MEIEDEYSDNISDSGQTDATTSTDANKKKKRRTIIEDKTDIWLYFSKLESPKPKHKKGSCNVEIKTSKDVKICGHIINTDGSTGNFWSHLENHHGILRSDKKRSNNTTQQKIDAMFQKQWAKNPKRKQECDEALAEFLVDDMQPLYILKNEGFINLVKVLDPYYALPSDKYIKQLITKAYNYSKQELLTLFNNTIKFCSITSDLWTARDRQGYIGITCSFINEEFELQEIMLACQYLEYPHTGKNIAQKILDIVLDWGLEKKVIGITTDNGSNMVSASKLLPNIFRIPCAAHTLNLVVNKGLMPVEILIARAKRLINFFMSPKQNERLKVIQIHNLNETEVL
jgi:hypothetical protein